MPPCPTCAAIQALLNAGGLPEDVSRVVGREVGHRVERRVKRIVKRKASKWNKHVKKEWAAYKRKHPKGRKTFAQVVKAAKRSYRR